MHPIVDINYVVLKRHYRCTMWSFSSQYPTGIKQAIRLSGQLTLTLGVITLANSVFW